MRESMGSFSIRTDTKRGLDGFFFMGANFYQRQRCHSPLTSDHQEVPYEAERKTRARLCVAHWCSGFEEVNTPPLVVPADRWRSPSTNKDTENLQTQTYINFKS